MKFRIHSLELYFKRGETTLPFTDFNVFFGEMGSGKSSIARLIDYCLGGDIEPTPALQSEFVSAVLKVELKLAQLSLERNANSGQIRAEWTQDGEALSVLVPARDANGEVLPDTGIENVSDLVFKLSGIEPPKVRRSKTDDETSLQRLSLRDVLWYCYLDQDSFDSEFFYLEKGAHTFKQYKSQDVLRYILGFHQEKVAELEAKLEQSRLRRHALVEAAKTLRAALEEVGVGTPDDLRERQKALQERARELGEELEGLRSAARRDGDHAADKLREDARHIYYEIEKAELAAHDIRRVISENTSHLNELKTLENKFRRNTSARAILSQLEFEKCPRCAQALPERPDGHCHLCAQVEYEAAADVDPVLVQQDVRDRQGELEVTLKGREQQLRATQRLLEELQAEKRRIDQRLDEILSEYDSAYLSSAIQTEREQAAAEQELAEMARLMQMATRVEAQIEQIGFLAANEERLKVELVTARQAAERNLTNLRRLETLFLDCLVRSRITGFSETSRVEIKGRYLAPEVYSDNELITMSFSNMGSGGIKTLFKACFAVAIHRLAIEIGANLPTFLILDTPMKNISENTNRTQFEAFYSMLYELKNGELRDTQLIVIDNNYYPPKAPINFELQVRQMAPLSDETPPGVNLPLIPYYREDWG